MTRGYKIDNSGIGNTALRGDQTWIQPIRRDHPSIYTTTEIGTVSCLHFNSHAGKGLLHTRKRLDSRSNQISKPAQISSFQNGDRIIWAKRHMGFDNIV